MKGQYAIIDLMNMEFMKSKDNKILFYDTEEEAYLICGMYEFENVWIVKFIYNYIE